MDKCPTCGRKAPKWNTRHGIRVDEDARTAMIGGKVFRVTTREAQIFATLEEYYPRVATYDQIMLGIFGEKTYGQPSLIKVHVCAIRKYLAGTGWTIDNVHGRGYRLAREI